MTQDSVEKKIDSLMVLIETAFQTFKKSSPDLKFKSVSEIIKDDKSSAEFIRKVLYDEEYRTVEDSDNLFEFSKERAIHSVLTFFVGLVFLEFNFFHQEIAEAVSQCYQFKDVVRLWMVTSLYHDWGYYSKEIEKGNLDLKTTVTYYLLKDEYEQADWLNPIRNFSLRYPRALAYSYEEINAYDQYIRRYHEKNEDIEKIDHGILGGVKIFNRIVKRIEKDKKAQKRDDLLFAKFACLTIAQHNIFKSKDKEQDEEYGVELKKLHSNSNFRVSMRTSLLLLLSLVDTFECIKKFSKRAGNRRYITKQTILDNILLSVTPNEINIDLSSLKKKVLVREDTDLTKTFQEYVNGLCGFSSWTTLQTEKKMDDCLIIRLAS